MKMQLRKQRKDVSSFLIHFIEVKDFDEMEQHTKHDFLGGEDALIDLQKF